MEWTYLLIYLLKLLVQ